MGYHVEIDDSSKRLLDLLSNTPEQVFGKPYVGYILFLATEHDRDQLEWIIENAPALDSLTGSNLAYAVFAKRFPVKLRVDGNDCLGRKPRNLGEVDADYFHREDNVSRLVENGKFGVPIDKDELTAITYGTDIVARELNLIQHLPCLVIMDAIPEPNPLIVSMETEILPELFRLLRGGVARFNKKNRITNIKNSVKKIIEIQSKIVDERLRYVKICNLIEKKKSNISSLYSKIEKGISTKDPDFFHKIIDLEKSRIKELEEDLKEFPEESPYRISGLESQLRSEMIVYQDYEGALFSKCFEKELQAHGRGRVAGNAKSQSISFFSSLFKPDALMKLWELVQ